MLRSNTNWVIAVISKLNKGLIFFDIKKSSVAAPPLSLCEKMYKSQMKWFGGVL